MPIKENAMFLPALEEKKKREQQIVEEKRLQLPDYEQEYEEYIKNKKEEKPSPRVIQIQIF